MEYAIIVIDIGMTNKKVSVYDDKLVQLTTTSKRFDPVIINGIETHDLSGMEDFFMEQLSCASKKYPVRYISITTHGATFVCVDKNKKPCVPCVFYTHDQGEDMQEAFYAEYGDELTLQSQTLTPRLGSLINMAKGIDFAKKRFPEEFSNTNLILNYPQYWGYVLTGKAASEKTFLGCHTYLWNQKDNDWSSLVKKLGIEKKLAGVQDTIGFLGTITEETAKRTGLSPDTMVTVGIHDSNASLLPYLSDRELNDDFILNSTGTWCVSMHPQNEAVLTDDDKGKKVFFNIDAMGNPVKTAIFLGGMELDGYVKLWQKINGTTSFPKTSVQAVQKICDEKRYFIVGESVPKSGQFPGVKSGIWCDGTFHAKEDIESGKCDAPLMHDEQAFFAALNLSLAIQSETAFRRCNMTNRTRIYTEGGFRKNEIYNTIIASALNENEVYLTDIQEATSLGAALCAVLAAKKQAQSIEIAYNKVQPRNVGDYVQYKREWLKR